MKKLVLLLFLFGCEPLKPAEPPYGPNKISYAIVGEEATPWGHIHSILDTGTRLILVEKESERVYDNGRWVKVGK